MGPNRNVNSYEFGEDPLTISRYWSISRNQDPINANQKLASTSKQPRPGHRLGLG